MKPQATIGIDPGQTGAAVLISDESIDYFDWPGDPVQFANEIRQWAADYEIRLAIVEQVGAMPKQGISSTAKFMRQAGMIEGVLAGLQVPYQRLTPQKWQKGLIVKGDGKDSKERSLTVARRLYPQVDWLKRKKDHNRADALLMARVARGLK